MSLVTPNKGYVGRDFLFSVTPDFLVGSHIWEGQYHREIQSDFDKALGLKKLFKRASTNLINKAKETMGGELPRIPVEKIAEMLGTLGEGKIDSFFNTEGASKLDSRPFGGKIFNYIPRLIFVVDDKDTLIKLLEKWNVNQGPQKYRGNSSLIGHTIYQIDLAFRESMYNNYVTYHSQFESRNYKVNNKKFDHGLDWEETDAEGFVHGKYEYNAHVDADYNPYVVGKYLFSYKNIHMNLGLVN